MMQRTSLSNLLSPRHSLRLTARPLGCSTLQLWGFLHLAPHIWSIGIVTTRRPGSRWRNWVPSPRWQQHAQKVKARTRASDSCLIPLSSAPGSSSGEHIIQSLLQLQKRPQGAPGILNKTHIQRDWKCYYPVIRTLDFQNDHFGESPSSLLFPPLIHTHTRAHTRTTYFNIFAVIVHINYSCWVFFIWHDIKSLFHIAT